ncbi:MAG: hypothetical protein NTW21_01565 [Verrucomicrobia bacterium]|nr:hypothetical protein [Verrucomicrobiota bacterium]
MINQFVTWCGIVGLWVTSLSVVGLAQDNASVSGLFSDHMVLQRGMPVPVWGAAKAGTKVTVKFGPQEKTAGADKDGKWMVRLDVLKASTTPAELTITSATGNQPVKIADVLVGEVYLCGGHSNMAFSMKELRADDDMAKANFPLLRQSRLGEGWAVCSPATISEFCATSYYFGRRMAQETGIPIGLLNCSLSGTPIEKWIEPEGNKIRIGFDHVGKGLMVGSKKGKDPVQEVAGGKLKQFAIATVNPAAATDPTQPALKWVWAEAAIDGKSVVVSSPEVPKPVAVHYAYSRNPEGCNLYNKDGLPASPFRTED